MALPRMAFVSRDKTFKLENCRDLCDKLQREIERFNAAPSDLHARVDHAFNIVVTAWHLCDWVAADLTPAQQSKLKIYNRPDMQAIARQCRALHLCEQAANASKHWAVFEKYRDPNVYTIVTLDPIKSLQELYEQKPQNFTLYFKDGDTTTPAEKVFEAALDFWMQFIYQNEIAKDERRYEW